MNNEESTKKVDDCDLLLGVGSQLFSAKLAPPYFSMF